MIFHSIPAFEIEPLPVRTFVIERQIPVGIFFPDLKLDMLLLERVFSRIIEHRIHATPF
jgi:hypothetical protein